MNRIQDNTATIDDRTAEGKRKKLSSEPLSGIHSSLTYFSAFASPVNTQIDSDSTIHYNSFQQAFVREKLGWLKLLSRHEHCPIPFLK